MEIKNKIGIVARIIVGVVFILSAVTKYLSIEAVDLFVYEHQIFSWTVTTFATRLLIATEGTIGILLLLGIYPKQVKWLSIIMLAGFTVYVLLKPVLFNVDNENCHCFGTVLLLNDRQTLIKNIILLAVSYFMFWDKGINGMITADTEAKGNKITKVLNTFACKWVNMLYKGRRFTTVLISLICLITVNAVIMPEPLERKFVKRTASVDKDQFDMLIGLKPYDTLPQKDSVLTQIYLNTQDSVKQLKLTEGRKILCLYSTGCKYCKRSAIRLNVVRQKYNIADSSFALVFWGSNANIDSFFVRTNTKVLPHTLVHPKPFLDATKGRQPVIALLNNGKIEKLIKYPNINEQDIKEFLNIK